MAEPQKQQMGDGSDNIGQAAGQAAKAAKNAGKQAVKQAAKKGAEAAANAAAATVKAGVEGGKAVAEIAAGTAAGGPWGAIISAAWAMRHTLFKILVCLCLSVVFLIVMIVELPGIIINKALGLDGNEPTVSITEIYENLSETVSDIVQAGYDASMAEVERLISDGGYDRELSMNALINYAQSSAGYDTAYILSAYSTSMEQLSNDPEDMKKKLDGVAANMFPVTSVERENEVITPVTYYTYKPVTIPVVTKTIKTGVINGVPQYRYETAEATYYLQDQQLSSDTQIEVDAYAAVTLTLPVYSGSNITGTRKATYYQYTGKETLTPEKKTVKYLECTIHPFDNTVISTAFGLDLNASYIRRMHWYPFRRCGVKKDVLWNLRMDNTDAHKTKYKEERLYEDFASQVEEWEEVGELSEEEYQRYLADVRIPNMIDKGLSDTYWECYWEAVSEAAHALLCEYLDRNTHSGTESAEIEPGGESK